MSKSDTGMLMTQKGSSRVSTTLSAVTTGTGSTADIGAIVPAFIAAVTASADITTGTLLIEGSIDNTSFYTLLSIDVATAFGAAGTQGFTNPIAVAGGTTNLPFRYLRGRITVDMIGGTITVKVGGC